MTNSDNLSQRSTLFQEVADPTAKQVLPHLIETGLTGAFHDDEDLADDASHWLPGRSARRYMPLARGWDE